MGRKNYVYEDILKRYSTLRSAAKEKETNARLKIDESENLIEENKIKMEAAIDSGDQETYTSLYEDNTKNEAAISFFKGVLNKLRERNEEDEASAHELYVMADKEILRLKTDYDAEFVKLLQPLIEYSENMKLQIELLELAKNKIATNLEHKDGLTYSAKRAIHILPFMARLEQLLQSQDYRTLNDENVEAIPLRGHLYNNWHKSADEKYNKELSKWI